MKYAMVVSGKRTDTKSLLGVPAPTRTFAIERLRSEADVERRARAIRSAGGQVLAVGLEDDKQYAQRAKLAVLQLTNGSWSMDRARSYLMEHLAGSGDAEVIRLNRPPDPVPQGRG